MDNKLIKSNQNKEINKKKRLDNLIPVKKGEIRNPKGRPLKKDCLTSLLKEEIEKICPLDKNTKKRTWKELIVIATMSLAIKGNATALKEVWERVDGKVSQPITGDPENPINIICNGIDITKLEKN